MGVDNICTIGPGNCIYLWYDELGSSWNQPWSSDSTEHRLIILKPNQILYNSSQIQLTHPSMHQQVFQFNLSVLCEITASGLKSLLPNSSHQGWIQFPGPQMHITSTPTANEPVEVSWNPRENLPAQQCWKASSTTTSHHSCLPSVFEDHVNPQSLQKFDYSLSSINLWSGFKFPVASEIHFIQGNSSQESI